MKKTFPVSSSFVLEKEKVLKMTLESFEIKTSFYPN
jgi:hypothetical protein